MFAVACANAVAVDLRVVAVNDFHGNLEPEKGEGGAVALAATLESLRAGHANTLFVSSGDLIGASPLPSALAHDEPTLALFKYLGLQANTIGNHELDGGLDELKRQESLAGFPFLSANLVDGRSGKPVFAPYRIVEVDGVRVAFVGATVRNALKPLEPDSVPGLRIDDEAGALNAQAALLRAQGLHALIALLHEGAGAQDAVVPAEGCAALAGPARAIAEKLDPDFDLVLSAHTHARYACRIGARWLLQGGANGRYLMVADLKLDRRSGDVIDVQAHEEAVRAGATTDPEVARLVDDAVVAAAKIANAPVARIRGGRVSAVGERDRGSPLGRVVARAQLAAGRQFGAELACTNPSSVPRDLVASLPGEVASYADVRSVQPYGNRLKVRRVTGAQLRALFEQQRRAGAPTVDLSCSPGFKVWWTYAKGSEVPAPQLRLHGRQLEDADEVVMVVNSYLARGGQGFSALVDAPEIGEAGQDLDALLAWLRAGNPIPPSERDWNHPVCSHLPGGCKPRRTLKLPLARLRELGYGLTFSCPTSQSFRGDRYRRDCYAKAEELARKLVARWPRELAPIPAEAIEAREQVTGYFDTFIPGRELAVEVGYLMVWIPLTWRGGDLPD
jgi:5'-nucleotidase